jgi:hypothetical protein
MKVIDVGSAGELQPQEQERLQDIFLHPEKYSIGSCMPLFDHVRLHNQMVDAVLHDQNAVMVDMRRLMNYYERMMERPDDQ